MNIKDRPPLGSVEDYKENMYFYIDCAYFFIGKAFGFTDEEAHKYAGDRQQMEMEADLPYVSNWWETEVRNRFGAETVQRLTEAHERYGREVREILTSTDQSAWTAWSQTPKGRR